MSHTKSKWVVAQVCPPIRGGEGFCQVNGAPYQCQSDSRGMEMRGAHGTLPPPLPPHPCSRPPTLPDRRPSPPLVPKHYTPTSDLYLS